jgi:hypothetical protein
MNRPFKTLAILLALLISSAIAYGQTNVALGIAITPITNTIMGDPSWVTDGEFGGTWYSYQGGGYNTCSFTVDLGTLQTISNVQLAQAQVYGYELHSSKYGDGSDWTLRSKVDYGISVANQITIDGGYQARYLRYSAYANWNQYVGVSEFQVFASGGGAPKPVPALSTWALIGLAMLMMGYGYWTLSHRSA